MTGSTSARPVVGKGTSICLMGPTIEHRDSLMAMLQGHAGTVAWIPDSHTYARLQGYRQSAFARAQAFAFGTRDRRWREHVIAALDKANASIVVAYWGTLPLADVRALKRARPNLKIVLHMLCYPLAVEPFGVARQRQALRLAQPHLDGVICPTEEMANYLADKVFSRRDLHYGVVAPCWPTAYLGESRPQPSSNRPHVIYVGRTDLSGHAVHSADDIRPLMREILEADIELHHGYSPECDDGHRLRRTFVPTPVRQLLRTIAAYDASLIAYNLAACRNADRFSLTVPDRLISSVAGGVPIAIPRRGYAASKQYLRAYPAVIEFDSAHDLRSILADRSVVHGMQEAAWKARERYTAEAHGGHIEAFLERVATAGAAP